jgi:acyl-CoA thioester hydrolase
MDQDYRDRTAKSIFTMENHVCYLQEVKLGKPVRVTAQLLDHDAKRARVFYAMFHGETGDLLATSEQLLMCIDMKRPTSAPFPSEIASRVRAIRTAHAALATPQQAGRSVGIRR